jgi:hypothetical protein
MTDLSIGWLIFIGSLALIALAAWLWWRYPQLRQNSFQLDPPIAKAEVIPLEQQYAEDIAAGRVVVVQPIKGRTNRLKYFMWLNFLLFSLVFYGYVFLPRCQLYFGVSGELVSKIAMSLFFGWFILTGWIPPQLRWSKAKADGYFPSRQTIQNKPFVAYEITDAIQFEQKRSIFFRKLITLVFIGIVAVLVMKKYKSYPHDWHAINAQLQQECLAQQKHWDQQQKNDTE